MAHKKYPTRSLTEVPGWPTKECERCGATFWSLPSQLKVTLFCSKGCRNEPWDVRLWKNVVKGVKLDDCWGFKLAPNADGYPYLKIDGKFVRVNRLIWELHNQCLIPDGLYILHSCDNPGCVNPEHLRAGTTQDNVNDRVERKRSAHNCGEKCATSKLTAGQVIDIKKNAGIIPGKDLAKRHGVSPSQISGIQRGRMWAHIVVDKPDEA